MTDFIKDVLLLDSLKNEKIRTEKEAQHANYEFNLRRFVFLKKALSKFIDRQEALRIYRLLTPSITKSAEEIIDTPSNPCQYDPKKYGYLIIEVEDSGNIIHFSAMLVYDDETVDVIKNPPYRAQINFRQMLEEGIPSSPSLVMAFSIRPHDPTSIEGPGFYYLERDGLDISGLGKELFESNRPRTHWLKDVI